MIVVPRKGEWPKKRPNNWHNNRLKLTSFLSPRPEVDTAGAANRLDLQLTAQLEELPQLEDSVDETPLPEPLSPLLTSCLVCVHIL